MAFKADYFILSFDSSIVSSESARFLEPLVHRHSPAEVRVLLELVRESIQSVIVERNTIDWSEHDCRLGELGRGCPTKEWLRLSQARLPSLWGRFSPWENRRLLDPQLVTCSLLRWCLWEDHVSVCPGLLLDSWRLGGYLSFRRGRHVSRRCRYPLWASLRTYSFIFDNRFL